jgi:pimeloyl-ACP methyl ester carboxylesterase
MNTEITKKQIRAGNTRVTCHCAGLGKNAETIVLLHGAGVDSAMLSWEGVIPLLAERSNVVAPDLPGYGESERIDGEYSLSFYTGVVKDIIEAIGNKPVVLAGLSLGGGIALNIALKYPRLIKALVPVDAWGLFAKLAHHRLTCCFIRSKLNEKTYAWTAKFPALIRLSLKQNLFGDASKVSDELLTQILNAMKKPDADRPFISFQRSEITPTGFTTDLFGRLEEIVAPTLIVHGSLDKAVPLKGAIIASQRIPDCEMHIMNGCKHWPQKERPEEFAEALQSYLDQKFH